MQRDDFQKYIKSVFLECLISPVVCIERKGKRELACDILQITLKPVDIKFLNRKVFFVFDKHIKNIVYKFNGGTRIFF